MCIRDRRNTVMSGNLGEGKRFCEIQKDGIVKSLCHMQGRMNPVRIFIERHMTFLAEKPAFMEGDSSSPVTVSYTHLDVYKRQVILGRFAR